MGAKRNCSEVANSEQPPSKHRKLLPQSTMLDDLSDFLLAEVLCRLDHNKEVGRCKLVSRRWRTLVSDPYFLGNFIRHQRDQRKPLQNAYLTIIDKKSVIFSMSYTPTWVMKLEMSIFSFLPCFQGHDVPGRENSIEVLGTYNDLVLCSPSRHSHRDYYICNSYTKEWVRVPPPTFRVIECNVKALGFICEPFYNINEDTIDASGNSSVKLNAHYKYKIVRLLPNSVSDTVFYVDIFSSKTGEWEEYQLPKELTTQKRLDWIEFCKFGFAWNGKLYWWSSEGIVLELDPFNIVTSTVNGAKILHTRFIDSPAFDMLTQVTMSRRIGVSQGRLLMCPKWFDDYPVLIWEMKPNQVDGKLEWCLIFDGVSLSEMVCKHPLVHDQVQLDDMEVIGFHPTYGDILYLQLPGYQVMCNVPEKTLEIATHSPYYEKQISEDDAEILKLLFQDETLPKEYESIYSYVFSWWPTPLPKQMDYHEITY